MHWKASFPNVKAARILRPEEIPTQARRILICISAVLLALLLSPAFSQAQQGKRQQPGDVASSMPSPAAPGPQEGKVQLLSSEQLFTLLAALNDAGYDTGVGIDTGDKTRDAIRAALAGKSIPVLPEIEKLYQTHRVTGDPGANLGQYISLALLLGPPPDFKLAVAPTDLPPDARAVAGLIPLLKAFYKQAGLINLWARAVISYRDQIERYSPLVRQSIQLSDAYLRIPEGSYLGRTYTIYIDLLGSPDETQARIYGSNYYLVLTPSKKLRIPEIRHQYLHFLLDPLAVKYPQEIQKAASLKAIARKAPMLYSDFKEDFSLLVTECLIRAVELRMDKVPEAEANKQVQDMTASGLILVPYFYEALADYQKQPASMTVYYQQMIAGINPLHEESRLLNVKFTQPPKQAAAPPELVGPSQILDEGDNDIYDGKYDDAKTVFEQVLQKDPQNERALFGLAVVASNSRKPDIARKYFEQTLDVAHNLRLVTWSHIYLGRIDDIEGNRTQALAQYRAASLTAAAYPEAARAVQIGLQFPFGSQPNHQ